MARTPRYLFGRARAAALDAVLGGSSSGGGSSSSGGGGVQVVRHVAEQTLSMPAEQTQEVPSVLVSPEITVTLDEMGFVELYGYLEIFGTAHTVSPLVDGLAPSDATGSRIGSVGSFAGDWGAVMLGYWGVSKVYMFETATFGAAPFDDPIAAMSAVGAQKGGGPLLLLVAAGEHKISLGFDLGWNAGNDDAQVRNAILAVRT